MNTAVHSRVRVSLASRSYDVHIDSGNWEKLGPAIIETTRSEKVLVVTSPEIGRLYRRPVVKSLQGVGLKCKRIDIPDRDRNKNLRSVSRLYDAFLEAEADRSTVVLALGGGVIGDMAGFASATYLRGIPFIQVPTTLLAMVDASIGGKTGVNLRQGKNLVGSFHQPNLVWINLETLQSLPRAQVLAGFAEIIKHAVIWDRTHFRELEKTILNAVDLEPKVLSGIVRRSCEIKAEVVSKDENEQGLRMLLNFGHTIGHAIESLGKYKLLHGHCVAIGMVYAAERSAALGYASAKAVHRLRDLLERSGLPSELPRYPRRSYLDAIGVDKKRRGSKINFVVLERIGKAKTVPLSPMKVLPQSFLKR